MKTKEESRIELMKLLLKGILSQIAEKYGSNPKVVELIDKFNALSKDIEALEKKREEVFNELAAELDNMEETE